MLKKIVAGIFIFILILSFISYASSGLNENQITVEPVSSQTGQYMAYVPSYLHPVVNKILRYNNINYTYYGNILTATYNLYNYYNEKSIFSSLNNIGISSFKSNDSNGFVPYLIVNTSRFDGGAYTPYDIYNAYDIGYIENSGFRGQNTTITIVDAYGDPNIMYDVESFDNITDLPPVNLSIYTPVGPITSKNSGWAIETAVDVEWSHAIAPDAKINLVLAPNSNSTLVQAVAWAVGNLSENVISLSWGSAESSLNASELKVFNSIYMEAADKNITVVAASGDNGADDGTSAKTVNFPAADPYVLSVGGTSLYCHDGTYSQTAWSGSGGGYSSYFSTPYYQNATGYNSTQRGVPDVSMVANPNTGVLIVVSGTTYKIGGTSVGTPIWAGIIALMDQYNNRSLGLVNPLLYQIARTHFYSKDFTQITSGSNNGYSAHSGWNPVDGLGTPMVSNLINDSRVILKGYGSIVYLNGTENLTEISASIDAGHNNLEGFNGSTYYFISMYGSYNNYVEFGILANLSGYYYHYIIDDAGVEFNGTFNGGGEANLTILYNNYNIIFKANNSKVNEINGILLNDAGFYKGAIGVLQENSGIYNAYIPHGTFSNLIIKNNSYSLIPYAYYESHVSGLENHGDLGITYNNKNFTAAFSYNITPGYLYKNGYKPEILYNLSYSSTSGLFLYANNGQKTVFYVNGLRLKGNSDKLDPGVYNVNATISGINVSRTIYIPEISRYNITTIPEPVYFNESKYIIDDYYFKYSGNTNNFSIYGINGNNSIIIYSDGYNTIYGHFNSTKTFTLNPKNITITFFVYNANTTVIVNGRNIPGSYGIFKESIRPEHIAVNITSPGFIGKNFTMNLYPSENVFREFLLLPKSSLYKVTGYITNIEFNYALAHVAVYSNGRISGYSSPQGHYIVFLPAGKNTLKFSLEYYKNSTLNINANKNMSNQNVSLAPANINLVYIPFKITYLFPFMFYFLYLSWNQYSGPDFGLYEIFYSTNPNMVGYHDKTIFTQGVDFTVLTNIEPGKTYYIIISAYTAQGAFISTSEVKVTYNLINYGINALIIGGIIAYILIMIKIFFRKRKNEEDWDIFNEFP